MNRLEQRAAYSFVALACIACGGGGKTDFFSPDRGGAESGGGGVQPGGSGGTGQAGAGAVQSGGSAGTQQGGAAGTGQGGMGVSGSAGAGSGGSNAGGGALSGGGGGSSGGGASGGTAGTGIGTGSFSCGSLMCAEGRQFCRRTLPAIPGGAEQRMCQPFPDSCNALDCSCLCKPPQMLPCEPGSACSCSGDDGRITVVCAGV